jgi:uncharacterized protein (TIGR03437 family)
VPDGQVIAPPFPALKLPVSVRIGGRPAGILYAGAAPGLVSGVLQVNARIPEGIVAGAAVPVNLVADTEISPPGVTIAVKPAFANP